MSRATNINLYFKWIENSQNLKKCPNARCFFIPTKKKTEIFSTKTSRATGIFLIFDLFLCMEYRFDFDSQAISPPAHDESFFYIRYPTGGASNNDKKPSIASNSIKSTISDAITKPQQLQQQQQHHHSDTTTKSGTTKSFIEKKIMVQHTEPCKKYLNQKERGEYTN